MSRVSRSPSKLAVLILSRLWKTMGALPLMCVALLTASVGHVSAHQPWHQSPAAFQFAGSPLLRSDYGRATSASASKQGIFQHANLGASLLPAASSRARVLDMPAVGSKRKGMHLSMQELSVDVIEPTIDCMIVLKKSGQIGVVQKSPGEGKYEVLMQTKKTRKIKDKDMLILHPGPVRSWELYEVLESPVKATAAKIKETYDYLAVDGGATDIEGLTSMLFGEHSPGGAWAAWKVVCDDLYFSGTPDNIVPYAQERVKALIAKRKQEATEEKEHAEFLVRAKENALTDEDHETRLGDLVDFAMGIRENCTLLKEIGIEQTPVNAHMQLLEWGHWDEMVSPWASRSMVNLKPHTLETPELLKEKRRDMTDMDAYAIDQQGTKDADDAISVAPDGKYWVHVADVGAIVETDSELDLTARERAASVYLPEGTVNMLPSDLVNKLGLGQQATSPALSFGFRLGEDGELTDVELCKSTIKAQVLTYQEVHDKIESGAEPWLSMYKAAMHYRSTREAGGAVEFQFPQSEVTVTDRGAKIEIEELPLLTSKELVMEFMVMAGAAAAKFALDNEIPFLFAGQAAPELPKAPKGKQQQKPAGSVQAAAAQLAMQKKIADDLAKAEQELPKGPPRTLSEMFQALKTFQRSVIKCEPERHYSLGLDAYSQVTSPLRRYGDLLAHQQLRAYLDGGEDMLSEDELLARVKVGEETQMLNKRAERFSKQHWTLVWMSRCEQWKGSGTCIDIRQTRPGGPRVATVLIQELGFMCQVKLKKEVRLDGEVEMELVRVRLPELRADLLQIAKPQEIYGTEKANEYAKKLRARKNLGTRMSTTEKRQG